MWGGHSFQINPVSKDLTLIKCWLISNLCNKHLFVFCSTPHYFHCVLYLSMKSESYIMSLAVLYWLWHSLWPDQYWALKLAFGCWPINQLGSSTNEVSEHPACPSPAWTVNIFHFNWYGFVLSIINNTVLVGVIIHLFMAALYVCLCVRL